MSTEKVRVIIIQTYTLGGDRFHEAFKDNLKKEGIVEGVDYLLFGDKIPNPEEIFGPHQFLITGSFKSDTVAASKYVEEILRSYPDMLTAFHSTGEFPGKPFNLYIPKYRRDEEHNLAHIIKVFLGKV